MRDLIGTFIVGAGLAAGCGGGAPVVGFDAGPPPVSLQIDAAHESPRLGDPPTIPHPDYHFVTVQLTIEANTVSAAIAPSAFTLVLEDGATAIGSGQYTGVLGAAACSSRNIQEGQRDSCSVAFEVSDSAATPVTLRWTDGRNSASAPMPPAAMAKWIEIESSEVEEPQTAC